MHFDWSSLLLAASLVNLIITAGITLFSVKFRANRKAKAWFLILILCIAFILVEDIVRNSQLVDQFPHLLFISTPILFIIQPALYFYQHTLNKQKRPLWPHLILPILNLLMMSATFRMNAADKLAMFQEEGITDPLWIVLFYTAYFTFYQLLIFRDHKLLSAALENEYSKNSLEWQKLSSQAIALSGFALFAIPITLVLQYFNLPIDTEIFISKGSTVIFSLISHVLLFSLVLSTDTKKLPTANRKKEEALQQIGEKPQVLLDFVKLHKPYLNNDLTLNSLADQIGWSRSELSAIINRGLGLNFYDFVNSQRMEALSERIKNQEDETYTLDYLVESCGFTNYVSFYRYVKRTKGLTPSAFVMKVKAQK